MCSLALSCNFRVVIPYYVVFTKERARGKVDQIGSLAQAWCCADLTIACFNRAVSCWTLGEVVNRFATWVNDTS